MNKSTFDKYNIFLNALFFLLPLFTLNISYYFISNINYEWALKEQSKKAIHEAETLSSESNFNNGFAIHFRDFFDSLQNKIKDINKDNKTDSFLSDYLKKTASEVFEKPFPKYNLYVFRIPNETKQTELLFYDGSLIGGKRTLCKAFEQLYQISYGKISNSNYGIARCL